MDEEIDDQELFDTDRIEWTLLRTKNLCRITMVAKSDVPINAMALYLSLEALLQDWKNQLSILDAPPELQ